MHEGANDLHVSLLSPLICPTVLRRYDVSFITTSCLAIYTCRADNTYVHVICSQSENPLYEKFRHQANVSTKPRKGFRDVALDLQVNPDLERNSALWYATCRCPQSMSYFVQVILARHSERRDPITLCRLRRARPSFALLSA